MMKEKQRLTRVSHLTLVLKEIFRSLFFLLSLLSSISVPPPLPHALFILMCSRSSSLTQLRMRSSPPSTEVVPVEVRLASPLNLSLLSLVSSRLSLSISHSLRSLSPLFLSPVPSPHPHTFTLSLKHSFRSSPHATDELFETDLFGGDFTFVLNETKVATRGGDADFSPVYGINGTSPFLSFFSLFSFPLISCRVPFLSAYSFITRLAPLIFSRHRRLPPQSIPPR